MPNPSRRAILATIILRAGIFSWSVVGYKTQPVIAHRTRVCAFDRAGYGFSDPGPRPQIVSDVVDDLRTALMAGAIPGPYVLVGHSLGGIEVHLFAQRWPKEVAGMVLVDTALAGEGLIDENQPGFDELIGGESYAADMLHCAFLVMHAPLEPSNPEYDDRRSASAMPRDTPAAFRAIWPQFFTAYYFADKVSLMSSVYTHRYDSADHRRLGEMPLVVLTAEDSWGNSGSPESVCTNPTRRFGLQCVLARADPLSDRSVVTESPSPRSWGQQIWTFRWNLE